jgi:hypothetical protein
MRIFDTKEYTEKLILHYESYFGAKGIKQDAVKDPEGKLHQSFSIYLIPPNSIHEFFCYCTVGMSADRLDENLVELVLYTTTPDDSIIQLLTYCASFHRNKEFLNLHHTVNIGQPWLGRSKCDHGFISLPYLDGPTLELFTFSGKEIHCYWFIPITKRERDYKIENGCEALELLFEQHQFNYLDPERDSLF